MNDWMRRLNGLNRPSAPSTGGLFLGGVFSILAFTGFESVAPLAEESENPRRNLPRAIIGSILVMVAFYVFTSWAFLIGWGTNDWHGFATASENPVFRLGKELWGGAWIIVFLAVINSILAVSIATTTAATRVFFAKGRSGCSPAGLTAFTSATRHPWARS